MDSVYENVYCLHTRIEEVRRYMQKIILEKHLGMVSEEAVQLSQLLDEYIVYYMKGKENIDKQNC